MSISPPIPEIYLFQNFTLKIQGQGHGEVKVQFHIMGPTSYWLTSILFYVNHPSHYRDMFISKFDLEKFSVMGEVRDQGHTVGPAYNQHTYSFNEIWKNHS